LLREESDHLLVSLVELVNIISEPTEGIDVVLLVEGATVCGRMIPNWQWAEEMASKIQSAYDAADLPPGQADSWTMPFRKLKESLQASAREHSAAMGLLDKVAERYQSALVQVDQTGFIHLKDAQVRTPEAPGLPQNGMPWRGRLEAVSGWSFGDLGPNPA